MSTSVIRNVQKKVLADLKSQKPTCGECVGFCREILKDKKLCVNVGITETSKICNKFKPNTYELIPLVEEGKAFDALKTVMSLIDDDKLRLVGAAFMREKLTRDAGYRMGQKVYVRFRGQANSNYMSNFFSGYILFADTEMIRVTSLDGKCCMTFAGQARSVIYTSGEFKNMRNKMVKAGRYSDPDVTRMISKRLRCMEEYELGLLEVLNGEVPTIDSVMEAHVPKSKGMKKGPADLRDIVSAIESGFDVRAVTKKIKSSSKSETPRSGKVSSKGVVEYDVSN